MDPERLLIQTYIEAAARLRLLVRASAARGARGTAAYHARQHEEVRQVLRDLGRRSAPLALRAVLASYIEGLRVTWAARGQRFSADAELDAAFSGVHRTAVEVAVQALANRLDDSLRTVGRSTDDVFRRVGLQETATSLATGQEGRASAARIADELEKEGLTSFVDRADRRWSLEAYSSMATRTTTREARTAATAREHIQEGGDLVTVTKHRHPTDACTPYEGKTYSLSGRDKRFPRATVLPPFHPNFLVPGTRVETLGEPLAGCRAQVAAPLVHLATAGGVRLTIGPNHPVLTARGWVAAKLLGKGDCVVRRCAGQRDSASSAEENLERRPACAEEILDALAATGNRTSIAGARHHFHGDGRYAQGEVDVVWADRLLAREGRPALVEEGGEMVLVRPGAEHPVLARLRAPNPSFERVGAAIRRPLADGDAASIEAAKQSATADAHLCGELLRRFAVKVTLDELVEVRQINGYGGQALDLQTESGYYFADSLLVSNCAHAIYPARQGLEDLERELGIVPAATSA